MSVPTCWTAAAVARMLSDLIAAEMARLRPGLLGLRNMPESPAATADEALAAVAPGRVSGGDLDLLELDSLEFLDLATAVTVQFHLHETGLDNALMASRRRHDWIAIVQRSRALQDDAISFLTSGSTGQPKRCTHSMRCLEQEIAFFSVLLQDRQRILSAVPAHHIYGFLFSILLPARLGIPVRNVRDTLPGSVLRRAVPGDLILAHPAFFELATRAPVAVAADVVALTSTAPCPAAVWSRLDESGLARVIEIYGASETAGIGVREAQDAPFRLLPHWLRIGDSPTRLGRSGAAGALLETALPDAVRWYDERAFAVIGRRDGAVQVGGANVFLERVQRCLCEHPEVAQAQVRLASAEAGARLQAFVVPSRDCRDAERLPERLHLWLAQRLAPAERPRSIAVGAQLPSSALGKPMAWD